MDAEIVDTPRGDLIARRTLLAGLVGTAAIAVAAPRARASSQVASKSVAAAASGELLELTLYAVALPDGNYAYGHTPETASIPGPTIEMVEGDTLHLRVINTTDQQLSAHAHGVDYTIENDGSPQTGTAIEAGAERTYVWRTHAAQANADGTYTTGSAGYWHYHDHALGNLDHGTEGIRKGLYGPIVVRRAGDPLPDRQNIVVINDMSINNRLYPNTPTFTAQQGERVEWVVIGHGNLFHTFHLDGHRWADNRTGLITGPDDRSRVIDTRTVGPADSFGFQVVAGARSGPGLWEYRSHVQRAADLGVYGFFEVLESESLPVVTVTGIAADQTYGDSLSKVVSWTVSGGGSTGESSATLDGAPIANGATLALYTLPLGQHVLEVVARGSGGDTTETVTFTTKTSFSDIEALVVMYRSAGSLSERTESGLLDRLSRAEQGATAGSEKRAIGYLEQFVARVENQVGGDGARQVLSRDARALIAELRALDEAENGR